MNYERRWIFLIVVLLSLTTFACGLLGGDEPTPTPVQPADSSETNNPEPTDTPEIMATAVPSPQPESTLESDSETDSEPADSNTPAASTPTPNISISESGESGNGSKTLDIELDPFNSTTYNQFDSYSLQFSINFNAQDSEGNPVNQSVNAAMDFISEPASMSLNFTAEGIEGADQFGDLSIAQIGDTSYMVLPEMGCITSSTEELNMLENNPFGDLMASDNFASNLDNAEYAGSENINGIDSDHYILDTEDLDFSPDQEVEFAEGHVYIAKDGGFPVKFVMDGVGQFDIFGDSGASGDFHIEMELANINNIDEIGLPEACSNATSADSEFPILEDASEYNSFAGLVSYQSSHTLSDAADFYDQELAAAGWTKSEEDTFVTEASAIVSYNKDGVELSLLINDNGDGTISVTLISDDGP